MALIKYTAFDGQAPDGTPLVEPVRSKRMASYHNDYMPAIGAFLDRLVPERNCLYVLSNAMGASEVWGSNRNGDLFPARPFWGLAANTPDWGYRTFATFAHVFRQHKNRLAEGHPSYGRVLCSVWNPTMWRVECLSKVERGHEAIEDIVSDIDENRPVAVSMGCRIPFDECTLCGNWARTTQFHCHHLKSRMNEVEGDGTQIAMINYYPIFFDLSFVQRGADAIAFAHRKLTEGEHTKEATLSRPPPPPSSTAHIKTATYDDDLAIFGRHGPPTVPTQDKRSTQHKRSVLYKRVEGNMPPFDQPPIRHAVTPRLRPIEPDLPRPLMRKWAEALPMGSILSTLYAAGIDCRLPEFQYMVLIGCKKPDLAERYADQGVVGRPRIPRMQRVERMTPVVRLTDTNNQNRGFPSQDPQDPVAEVNEPVGPTRVNGRMLCALADDDWLAHRSYWRSFLFSRAARLCANPQLDPTKPPEPLVEFTPTLQALAELWLRLKAELGAIPAEELLRHVDTPTAQCARTAADRACRKAHVALVGDEEEKDAGVTRVVGMGAVGVPSAYMASGHYTGKEQQGQELSWAERKIKDRPGTIGIGGAVLGSYGITKARKALKKRHEPPKAPGAIRRSFGRMAKVFTTKRAEDAAFLLDVATLDAYNTLEPTELNDLLVETLVDAEERV